MQESVKKVRSYLLIFIPIGIFATIVLTLIPIIPQTYEKGVTGSPQFSVSQPPSLLIRDWESPYIDAPPSELLNTRLLMLRYGYRVSYVYRELVRDDELITVVYFNLSTSAANLVLPFIIGRFSIDELLVRGIDDDPRTVEIYFLSLNQRRIQQLCDESFDAKRVYGQLVWNGIV